jgi:hypothetical protein
VSVPGRLGREGRLHGVDVTATLTAAVPPPVLFAVVADLGTYPSWLDIVPRAEPADPDPVDGAPAWTVDLRGQLGPLRRSKRLRMVRAAHEPDAHVRFERREDGGRAGSPWVLDARITPTDGGAGSSLAMHLHYGGSLWVPLLDRLLGDEIERSRPRLLALLDGRSTGGRP